MIRSLMLSLIAGLSSILGYFITYLKLNKEDENKIVVISLAISVIVMLYISIFDLIPLGYTNILNNHDIIYTIITTTILFLSGVGIVELGDKITDNQNNELLKIGILSMITLMLHNIPEGIITYISNISNNSIGIKMTLGILIHNIPEGILIALPIYYSTKKHFNSFIYTFIAGISEFIGALLFAIIFKYNYNPDILNYLLIIVGGMMINLSINKINKETKNFNLNRELYIGYSIGIIIVILMHLFI